MSQELRGRIASCWFLNHFWYILILSLPYILFATESNFYHPSTHRSDSRVTEFNTLGERCSGTSFVDALLRDNFPNMKRAQRFAHKHFFPWLDLKESDEYVQQPWRIDEEAFLQGSENNLFVLVVRNHQDWLRSFFLQPFYVPASNLKHGFFHFVRSEWKIALNVLAWDYYKKNLPEGWTFKWPYQLDAQYYDSNVYSGRPFKNILELRSYKARNYLEIGSRVKNFIVLRYEDVRQDPEGCVNYISEFYGIEKRSPFKPIVKYKGVEQSREIYVEKKYAPIPSYVEVYIQKHLDYETERKLGY